MNLFQQLARCNPYTRVCDLEHRLEMAYNHIDVVYTERNAVISLAVALAYECGIVVGLGIDEEAEEGFRHVIFLDLPSGQVSWHIPDEDLSFFGDLPTYQGQWDGHTIEVKYQRVLAPQLERLGGRTRPMGTPRETLPLQEVTEDTPKKKRRTRKKKSEELPVPQTEGGDSLHETGEDKEIVL